MNTALGYIYRTEEVEINVAHSCVRRLGIDHVLRHQSFQVLLYLLERSGKLVTKEELTAEIWRDAAVTDNALTQCIAEIRKAFGDHPRNPTYIRTVSKVGYSFMAPVELILEDSIGRFALSGAHKVDALPAIAEVTVEPSTLPMLADTSPVPIISKSEAPLPLPSQLLQTSLRKKIYLTTGICCGVLILLGFLIGSSRKVSSGTPPVIPPSNGRALAVMYFENESQRGEFDWLRQGLTDMMITDLSRTGELHVLSRQQLSLLVNTKDGQTSLSQAMQVAQTIHAADFLTGSFCALDGQFRIDIQLHDASNGQIIFADHSVFPNTSGILSQVDVLAEHLANAMALNSITKPNIAEVTTNNVEAYQYYSLGVEKAQEFENAQALSLLKQATELDPGFAMAYARIGYTYALTDFAPEKGKPYFEKALQLSGHLSEKDRLSIQAWYAISKADYATAAQKLSRISQLYPQETEAYSRLARLLRAEEHPQEALAILQRGLEVNPDDKDLHNTLGFVLLSLHRYPEAIDTYQRYVELAPNEPNAHDSLGMAYEQSGSYEDAVSEYNRALALNAEFEPSLIHLGDTYYQTGQYEKAVDQYQKYIQIANTTDAQAMGYGDLVLVYLAMDRMPEAEKAAASEVKCNPNAVWGSLLIALKKSDYTTVEHLKQVLFRGIPTQERGTPGDQRTKFYYEGYIDLQEGNTQKALTEFSIALQHLPPSSGIDTYEDCLANAELQLGHFQEAASEFNRILQLNPNYPRARAHLAEAQMHLSEQKHS
jgi:tetratricopeptide (TPR) repeat protein/DNA-binding winged helix-turn-helix (wHTH) protein